MHFKETEGEQAVQKRRLRSMVIIIAAVLVLLLLTVAGFRLHGWLEQRSEARVMVLVNPWNDVDKSGFVPKLKKVDGVQVDQSCARELTRLLADCRESGCSITITAAYRSREEQLKLFNNEVNRQMAAGYSADTAYTIAEQRIGAPGTSEHELGLAIDVQGAAAQEWMKENGWRYGFILRYPEGAEGITGRSADAAHYRYVGQSAAEQIYTLQISFEEYMGMFFSQEAEIIFQ